MADNPPVQEQDGPAPIPAPALHAAKRVIKLKVLPLLTVEPYVAALSNCFMWSLYGLYGGETISFSVLVVNCTGVIFNLGYLYVFIRHCNSVRLGLLRMVAGAAVTLAITGAFAVGGCCFGVSYGCNKAGISGWSGAFLSFAMYLVPAIQNFINVQEMPLQMVMASLLNAFVWFVYGVSIGDIRMSIPSVLGVVLCLAQLLVYHFWKPRGQDPQGELSEEEDLLHAE